MIVLLYSSSVKDSRQKKPACNIAYSNIYAAAKKSILVIDNYIGVKTLVLLKDVAQNISITIFSDNLGKGLSQSDYDDFSKQYPIQISLLQRLVAFFITAIL